MVDNANTGVRSYLEWSNRGKASWWRYLVGFVLVNVVFHVLSGMLLVPFLVLVPNYEKSVPLSLVAKLLAFPITFLAIPMIVKVLHARPSWSVAMPMLGFRPWDFFTGLWVSFAVAALATLAFQVTGVMPLQPNPAFDLRTVLLLAVIGFVGIFVQAGAEELTFRGYFTQLVDDSPRARSCSSEYRRSCSPRRTSRTSPRWAVVHS